MFGILPTSIAAETIGFFVRVFFCAWPLILSLQLSILTLLLVRSLLFWLKKMVREIDGKQVVRSSERERGIDPSIDGVAPLFSVVRRVIRAAVIMNPIVAQSYYNKLKVFFFFLSFLPPPLNVVSRPGVLRCSRSLNDIH